MSSLLSVCIPEHDAHAGCCCWPHLLAAWLRWSGCCVRTVVIADNSSPVCVILIRWMPAPRRYWRLTCRHQLQRWPRHQRRQQHQHLPPLHCHHAPVPLHPAAHPHPHPCPVLAPCLLPPLHCQLLPPAVHLDPLHPSLEGAGSHPPRRVHLHWAQWQPLHCSQGHTTWF
jgi:hypothetical protein